MNSVWLFGYGSLIWRPDFEYVSARAAWVEGWSRRFWQGSHDHRGVPEAPGRVVTLMPAVGEYCGGMAFEIRKDLADDIFSRLDYREKNGYDRCEARLLFDRPDHHDEQQKCLDRPAECSGGDGSGVDGIFYVANDDNPAFLGPASSDVIARQISVSHGPSGSNADYLYNLAQALRDCGIDDPHVFEIETALASINS